MIETTSGAATEALFDSGLQPTETGHSRDGAAFGDTLLAQNQDGPGYPQGGQAGQTTDEAAAFGQRLLAQGDRLVEEGMALLGRGQKAEGMRLLRDGAELQRRGALLSPRGGTGGNGPAAEGSPDPQTPGGQQKRGGRVAVTVEVSVPLQHTSLAIHNFRGLRPPRQDGTALAPSGRTTASVTLRPGLTASGYGRMGTDQFFDSPGNRNSSAAIGAALTGKSGQLSYRVNYERNHAFDGLFAERVFTSDDYSASVSYGFATKGQKTTIRPALDVAGRRADVPAQERVLFTERVDIDRKLTKDLSLIGRPAARVFVFTNDARRETIVNAAGGVKYSHKDFGVTTLYNYEKRMANIANRNYGRHVVSVTFDISRKFQP